MDDSEGHSSDTGSFSLSNRLALERTRVAYERTMMAWARTSTSMITFGFTVYKFFEFELARSDSSHSMFGPRGFGLTLIAIGMLTLLIGRLEHRRDLDSLKQVYPEMPLSGTRLISTMVGAFGALALIAVILRV